MSRWIYVFSPNDWGHLEATARWSKICIGVQLSCSGEKAKGNLGRMPKAGGESIHPPCSLIHLAELSQSPPSHEGWYYPQWRERGRIEGRRKEKRAEQRCQKRQEVCQESFFWWENLKNKSPTAYIRNLKPVWASLKKIYWLYEHGEMQQYGRSVGICLSLSPSVCCCRIVWVGYVDRGAFWILDNKGVR